MHKQNPFKSMIKSIVRALWKIIFKPIFKLLPDNKLKYRLMRAGGKIERREWWPKPKPQCFNADNKLNKYLLEELKDLSQIEFLLMPTSDFLHHLYQNTYAPNTQIDANSFGATYGLLHRHLGTLDFDTVFLAPYIKRGGADLGLLHHINAQVEKGFRVLLITTLNTDSPWLKKLPENVAYLDFGKLTGSLTHEKKIEVLARLLLTISAQSIHNIQSETGWEVFAKYGTQFRAVHKKLFASVFCEDETPDGNFFGYAPKYLSETYRFLSNVFCDTQWYPQVLCDNTGLDKHFIQTVYFPFLQHLEPEPVHAQNRDAPILWASRIARQKRPELLYEIAKQMPEKAFHIYGECEKECLKDLDRLKTLPNVKYFGKYDSFCQLISENKFAAFLYTSKYDGLPNVLIEAIAAGLPVISYNVGGISELIHKNVLLSDNDNLADNVAKIRNLLENGKVLADSWKYSKEILENRHSWQHFIDTLEQTEGYFPTMPSEKYKASVNIRMLSRPNT